MSKLFHSVRWNMLLWYALMLLALVEGACLLAYRLASNDRMAQIDKETRNFHGSFWNGLFVARPMPNKDDRANKEEIRDRLRNPGDVSKFPQEIQGIFKPDGGGGYIGFWDKDGTPLFISANAPEGMKPPRPSKEGPTQFVDRGDFREMHRYDPEGIS